MDTRLDDPARYDGLGNPLDPEVKYARGKILRNKEDEARRQQHGFDLISNRIAKNGIDSLYNLLGVVRDQPLRSEDLPELGFLSSIAHVRGKAEASAVSFLGGDPKKHVGFVTNRVSASSVVGMLAMVKHGDTVLCASPDGRTHPSVKLGIKLAGGNFIECVGYRDVERYLDTEKNVRTIVVTTITPQLRHLPFREVEKIVSLAKSRDLHTYIDDAHGAVRTVAYKEPGAMKLDPDVVALSSDKHIYGPRAGVMAGQKEMMEIVRATALEFGVEAQTPILAGVYRALKNHTTDHIERALAVAEELRRKVEQSYPKWFYFDNDCVAMTDESVIKLLIERSRGKISMVPQEACSALSMLMLEKFGIITVSAVAAPGAAPYLRLVAWPDGHRLATGQILQALDYAVSELCKIADDQASVRKVVMGT
jgi:L-seryl-tRNA(Ser) seleniumtransferase